ncbi:Hsp20/alpha crystallin family protein [Olivibacter sitiensis]|uniref:Hsp20/alpha crystallin family protein n=1 Tax=Olivibacter sitiensis TaxID=376470 RepID=UPI000412EDB0|nr:Hsp20/alpha crystallin family protein [Olivibacter sitiensis]
MNASKYVANHKSQNRGVDNWVDSLFDGLFAEYDSDKKVKYVPAVNLAESNEGFHVDMAVPGFNKEDIKIQVEKNILTISAEKKEEDTVVGKCYNRKEFNYSNFSRSFTLPESADVNKISAAYKNGILEVSISKKEEEKAVLKSIEIQ